MSAIFGKSHDFGVTIVFFLSMSFDEHIIVTVTIHSLIRNLLTQKKIKEEN